MPSSKVSRRASLTSITIPDEQGAGIDLTDLSLFDHTASGKISVYFRDMERHLIDHIDKADCVFGCVAWLTNENILNAISKKRIAQILIQKEDFLRPDVDSGAKFKPRLRSQYTKIRGVHRAHFGDDIAVSRTWTIVSEAERIDGVRCVGYRKQHHAELIPIMHHKFLVFCKYTESPHEDYPFGSIEPYAVWTGSFNFTENGTRSFENVVVIEDSVVAEPFLQEWGQLAALSEPLDWKHEYVAPEYWIGTGT